MIVQIDTREKPRAIEKILAELDSQGIKHFSSKLYVGDYVNMENPLVFIDRKQNIAEIAQNATSGHARVKRELQRLDEIGGKMYFLIEQNKVGSNRVEKLEDIMYWKPKYGVVDGFQVYKILNAWRHKHNIEFVFCNKRSTGKRIIELLEVK